MKKYEQQGFEFLELEVTEDGENITVTRNGLPIVLVRDNIVNVLTMPGIEVKINNAPYQEWSST